MPLGTVVVAPRAESWRMGLFCSLLLYKSTAREVYYFR